MNEADRIAELEKRVAVLEGRTDSIERAERELLDAARQWARVKQLGHYIERDGTIIHAGVASNQDYYERAFMLQLTRAALNLLDLEAKPR